MAHGSSDGNIDVHEEERQIAQWIDDYFRDKDKFQIISESEYIILRLSTISHEQILLVDETKRNQPSPKKQGLDIDEVLPRLTRSLSLDLAIPPDLDFSLKVLLVGKAGNGKSATGNTLLGRQVFEESQKISKGTEVTCLGVSKRDDITLHVIDTPGLFDPGMDEIRKQREISRSVAMSYEGVHAFLFIVSMHSRFTEEELDTMKEFKKQFGTKFAEHTILVFTHAHSIITGQTTLKEVCKEMEDEGGKYKGFIEEFGNRIIAIDNQSAIPGFQMKIRDALILMALNISDNGKISYKSKLHITAQNTKEKIKLNESDEHIYKLMESSLRENSLFIYNVDQREIPEEFIVYVEGELVTNDSSTTKKRGSSPTKEDIEASTLRIMDREKRVFDAVLNDFESWPTKIKRSCVIL